DGIRRLLSTSRGALSPSTTAAMVSRSSVLAREHRSTSPGPPMLDGTDQHAPAQVPHAADERHLQQCGSVEQRTGGVAGEVGARLAKGGRDSI
ncbi:hypothetical protein LTR53_019254, partial [Teratosphaeriaceae sp. CCFEE 6253]